MRAVGSPNYLAPELLTGESGESDYSLESSDMWGLGCILFVMCAGHLPFPDEGEVLFQKIIAGQFKKPIHFSENLLSLISHLIEPDWHRRYSIQQTLSHPWCRDDGSELKRSVDPKIIRLSAKESKSLTFSSLETVKVVPRAKPLRAESKEGEAPFINCFEYLADIGIFDLSRMMDHSKHVDKIYYAFSSTLPIGELIEKLVKILSEEKKMKLQIQEAKHRIKAQLGGLRLVVSMYRITSNMHLVDFKKMRGSALDMAKVFQNVKKIIN